MSKLTKYRIYILLGFLINKVALFSQVIVGNGSQGCNTNNGVDALTIPLHGPAGVSQNNAGNIYWTEIGNGCTKLAVKINGLQQVVNTNLTVIDVASGAGVTAALVDDGRVYEVVGTTLGSQVANLPGATKIKINNATGLLYGLVGGNVVNASNNPVLNTPLDLNDFDVYQNVIYAIDDGKIWTKYIPSGQTQILEYYGGTHIGMDRASPNVIIRQPNGNVLRYNDNNGIWYNVGSADPNDWEQKNGYALITTGNQVVMINTQGGTPFCPHIVYYPDNTCFEDRINRLSGIIASSCSSIDTIHFSNSLNGTVQTIACDINIYNNYTIVGNGIDSTILSGTDVTRIFRIWPGKTLTLENMTLENAKENTNGGAILNEGTLILKNVRFRNNFEGANRKVMTNLSNLIIGPGTTIIQE